jgi:hypothetical protein
MEPHKITHVIFICVFKTKKYFGYTVYNTKWPIQSSLTALWKPLLILHPPLFAEKLLSLGTLRQPEIIQHQPPNFIPFLCLMEADGAIILRLTLPFQLCVLCLVKPQPML